MTIDEFRNYVRSLIAEPQASYWTDDEIDVYTEIALILIFNDLWGLLYPVYNKTAYLSVEANNPYIPLPEDCFKIISITPVDNHTTNFDYIPIDIENHYETNNLRGWFFENNQIRIVPTPTVSANNCYRIKYIPKPTFENIPDVMYPYLAVETVIQAKVKDENVPSYLLILEEKYKRNLISFLMVNQLQNEDVLTE